MVAVRKFGKGRYFPFRKLLSCQWVSLTCAISLAGSRPRYKEKLPSKCFQEHVTNKERFSDALNSQRWRFLKSDQDDFRDGYPPPADDIIIRGKKGPVPILLQYKKMNASQMVPYKARESPTKSNVNFSKLSVAQNARKDYIAQAERCLIQHPLALYPHLEESVSPELFKDIVRLLDPEMHMRRSSSSFRRSRSNIPTIQYQFIDDTKPEPSRCSTHPAWLPKIKNPYMWFNKKEMAEREIAAEIGYVPPLDENVKRVTKEFCEWVRAMGGEQYNIDEATVMKLFDTSYESKPRTSAPFKVVELCHVPTELRECLGSPQPRRATKPPVKTPSEPKWEKIRYGAWYLHPKKWKKQKARAEDEVPECLQKFLNVRKKMLKKERGEKIVETSLHGTYAFDRFLEMKGYRKPAFLLQMLAAISPERAYEESGYFARKLSMKAVEDFDVTSSLPVL